MTESLGQVVYIFKDKLVNAVNRTDCHTSQMAQRAPRPPQQAPMERPRLMPWAAPDKDFFARALATRVAAARAEAQLTQHQVAEKLGIPQWKYSKYENRGGTKIPTPIPHIYLARFCEVTGAHLKDLLRDPR